MGNYDIQRMYEVVQDIHIITSKFRGTGPVPDYDETIEALKDELGKVYEANNLESMTIAGLCLGMRYALNALLGFYSRDDLDPNTAWVVTRYLYYATQDIEKELEKIGD